MRVAAQLQTMIDHGATQMGHACMQKFLPSQALQVPAGFTAKVAANAWTAGCTQMMI